jgi:hypothetical protein
MKADSPIRLIDGTDHHHTYPPIVGKEIEIVSIGDLGEFLANRQGAYCRILDGTKYEGGSKDGRPFGAFFLDQMDNDPAAERVARRIVDDPPELVETRGVSFVTSRGDLHIEAIYHDYYVDRGQHPWIPDDAMSEIRERLARALEARPT